VEEMKKSLPRDLTVVVTGDMSTKTRTSFNDLVNSIVIGFMLVLIILMFSWGSGRFLRRTFRPTEYVRGLRIPAGGRRDHRTPVNSTSSCCLPFCSDWASSWMTPRGHRKYAPYIHARKGKISAPTSARMAAGEVFIPVLQVRHHAGALLPPAILPGIIVSSWSISPPC